MFPTSAGDSLATGGVQVPPLRQIVLLGAGGRRFGVPIDVLREIIPARPFTPLPGSAVSVCGLINLRGRIVTTIDLGARLGLSPCSARPDHKIVIVDHAGTLVGLAVEEVAGIVRVDLDELGRPADALREIDPEAAHLRGIGSTPEGDYAVLDTGELFRTVLL